MLQGLVKQSSEIGTVYKCIHCSMILTEPEAPDHDCSVKETPKMRAALKEKIALEDQESIMNNPLFDQAARSKALKEHSRLRELFFKTFVANMEENYPPEKVKKIFDQVVDKKIKAVEMKVSDLHDAYNQARKTGKTFEQRQGMSETRLIKMSDEVLNDLKELKTKSIRRWSELLEDGDQEFLRKDGVVGFIKTFLKIMVN